MYEQFFGLTAPPFQINPDPSFYFESKGHGSAHQYLRFGAFQGEGFIVVTGDIGAGKTTLLRALLAELDPAKVVAAQIVSTQLEAGELLSAVVLAFGIPCDGMSKAKLLVTLEAYLASLATTNRSALLIIDEAQNLGPAAIEELRMLSNFQFGSRALLQSFLVGQPELRDILRLPQMEQLRQRVIASCHLGPMDEAETRAYIEHRLRHVGWNNRPAFADNAFVAIYHWSGGVPRRINMLCSRLLLSAFLESQETIDAARVDRVASEIRAELSGTDPATQPDAASDKPASATHATFTEPAQATSATAKGKSHPSDTKPPKHEGNAESHLRSALIAPPNITAASGAYLDLNLPCSPPPEAGDGMPGPLLCVAASQAGVVVMSALLRAFAQREDLPRTVLVQILAHDAIEDAELAARNAADLDLPYTDFILEPQAQTVAGRLAEVMATFAGLLNQQRPSAVILSGDEAATVVCAVAASQIGVPVVRVDAGLRHGDRAALRETNRVLIDHASSLLCAGERPALVRLQAEGIPANRVHMTGNPWIDAMHQALPRSVPPDLTVKSHGVPSDILTHPRGYALVWLEHALEGDGVKVLTELGSALRRISKTIALIWPMPAALQAALYANRTSAEAQSSTIATMSSLSYLEMLGLMREATCVLTDSGWLQDQSAALGIPCLTLATQSERLASIQGGTNVLVGGSIRRIFREMSEILDSGDKPSRLPELWDGHAAERIAWHLSNWLLARQDHAFRAYLERA
uniref:Putative fused protein UDP-N-acetylglucosamine 2-epimerase: transport, ATPase component n=1 Tax=mine drainage metagenome TaxID=410659 RepID=E6PVA1_9ZZZZ